MHPDYTIRVPRSNPTAMPFSMITMQLHIRNNPVPYRLSGKHYCTGQPRTVRTAKIRAGQPRTAPRPPAFSRLAPSNPARQSCHFHAGHLN